MRRGLGGAKATRGVILDNIKDMKGKPTEFYSYMPDNWSGDPFPIRIHDMQPAPAGASYAIPVPRHGTRTFDLGSQLTVGRRAQNVEQFQMPSGGTGYKVKETKLPPELVDTMASRLEKQGTPEAMAKLKELTGRMNEDGSVDMVHVLPGKDVPTIQAKHLGGGRRPTTEPSSRLGSIMDTPARQVAADVESSQEYLAREKELGADPDSIAIEKRKLGLHDVPGKAQMFFKGELEPVAKTLEPTTTQPSREIKPITAAAEREIRERMTAAGPSRAQKPIPPPPGPAEPGQPVQRGVTPEEIKQEARVSKPTETYKGQRKQEIAEEEAQRKRAEYKPGTVEAVKPTPPPGAAIPARVAEPKAPEAADALTRVLNKYKDQLKPLEATEAKRGFKLKQADELRSKIKSLESRTSAKLTEPPVTKPYTQPSTATKIPAPPSPTKVKATSTGGSTDSWTLSHPKGGTMEVRFTDNGVYVEQVRVPPAQQRQGIASEMYEQLGRMMKQRGIPGKNIEGNVQGDPEVVRKLRAKAAKIAGAGKSSPSRYDID